MGLSLIASAVPLMVRAELDISTISSLPYSLSAVFPDASSGTWNIVFQVSLLLILGAITGRFRTGHMASFITALVFGYIVDKSNAFMAGERTVMERQLLYFVACHPVTRVPSPS